MNTTRASDAKSILIVEDELLVRMFAVDALEDVGFTVHEAGDAAEAMRIFAASSDQFAGVVVDLGLPDRPGDRLAADIRALREDVPIVIASGRSEREIKDHFAGDGRVAVLVKPYTSVLLLDSLESLGVTNTTA